MNANKHSLRVTDYLGHMLDAIKLSRGYTRDLSKDEFIADRKTQQAVILNMVVIGEAATKLIDHDPTFAAQHPQIPWQKIRGMRNRLALCLGLLRMAHRKNQGRLSRCANA